MDEIINFISRHSNLILLWTASMAFIFFIFFIIIFARLSRLRKKYLSLMKGSKVETIEDLLLEHNKLFVDTLRKVEDIEQDYHNLAKRINNCVQKVGVVRYNAFYDTGSDLSFSIALLDEYNSGVVISGIYGRNDSTTYAKPITKGQSKYPLSEEENQAVSKALEKK